ncbi:MAG: L,D-peptidoglycan transpeptidase YkuD (ErfK/YbiS/YcfS/YnhG family) [Verrucomicrobiales bacterium]|jgi:L,D-peptidoglycan transpeptidase YkuD (ErfK/YbiS/YcfS/YnhG family)
MCRRLFLCVLLGSILVETGLGQRTALRAKPSCSQMVVTTTDNWDSSTGKLQCYERTKKGWQPVFDNPIAVLLGRNGLAWGRGLHSDAETGKHKREGDGRAPAGVFKIGKIYTHDASLPQGVSFPFHQIGKWDAWVDDPKLAEYNKHVVVDSKRVPSWFEKQKMRHGDAAYRWLIEVRHNADPPKPGHGSAIFFHTRRGPDRKTAGCTSMSSTDLIRLMKWLSEDKKPQYVLLPKTEYQKRKRAWNLPGADR